MPCTHSAQAAGPSVLLLSLASCTTLRMLPALMHSLHVHTAKTSQMTERALRPHAQPTNDLSACTPALAHALEQQHSQDCEPLLVASFMWSEPYGLTAWGPSPDGVGQQSRLLLRPGLREGLRGACTLLLHSRHEACQSLQPGH